MDDDEAFETAALAIADGIATDTQVALLEGDRPTWRRVLERLLDETEDHLDVVADLRGPERDQVLADFEGTLDRLEDSYDRLLRVLEPERFRRPPPTATAASMAPPVVLEPEEVRLQASWANGQVVVWAAGRGTAAADNDELADRLEAIGGPALGWNVHAAVSLPNGERPPPSRSRYVRRSAGSRPSAAAWWPTVSGPASPGSDGSRSPPSASWPVGASCPRCGAPSAARVARSTSR